MTWLIVAAIGWLLAAAAALVLAVAAKLGDRAARERLDVEPFPIDRGRRLGE